MVTKKTAAAIGGVVLGIFMAGVAGHAWSGTRSLLTFSGAVSLPGVTLHAGTYEFVVANPESGSNIVSVRTNGRACYLGFANRIDRPAGMREDRVISLGESKIGVAPPVLAWYPVGQTRGFEFIYPDHR
jgi:hypothetical protein